MNDKPGSLYTASCIIGRVTTAPPYGTIATGCQCNQGVFSLKVIYSPLLDFTGESHLVNMAFRLSDNVENIINIMSQLIENETAIRIKGDDTKNGNKIHGCTVWHFAQAANIKNPTEDLIFLLINGTAALYSGGPLTSGSFSYVKDDSSLIAGTTGVDVAIVVLDQDRDVKTLE